MRTPRADLLPRCDRLRVLALDVTDPSSIHQAVEAAGEIEVLVNNAGIGMPGALEGISMTAVREIFETNTYGTMALIQAVLPQFRQRRESVIFNVTSSVTVKFLPLLSVCTASKAAVNSFTKSLALELEQFNVRVNLVLPGRAPTTRFGENARSRMQSTIPESYADLAQNTFAEWGKPSPVTETRDVAEAVWRAAKEPSEFTYRTFIKESLRLSVHQKIVWPSMALIAA
ncbi:NAD(P)-dependent dehydrogenase (short-subunit alcohol dehydrogenase family) [Herbaspirillum sp. Sphag1AN]|nr:NAD(P)-dependent dehydrogenase (short-subunit alcohol dehydrogenase family) [Herbaspirillum sp. Sphag1AN]MBB3245888.1 NAD(P)-dependent dehydrogenase (short-subunit alcohol dehydrogenase family) [Herbaspirillum sp. Sphag64]